MRRLERILERAEARAKERANQVYQEVRTEEFRGALSGLYYDISVDLGYLLSQLPVEDAKQFVDSLEMVRLQYASRRSLTPSQKASEKIRDLATVVKRAWTRYGYVSGPLLMAEGYWEGDSLSNLGRMLPKAIANVFVEQDDGEVQAEEVYARRHDGTIRHHKIYFPRGKKPAEIIV